jgi:helix-turn-helix protein
MFPAGFLYKDGKLMVDKPWEEGAIKVIEKLKSLLFPIFMQKTVGYFIYFLKNKD